MTEDYASSDIQIPIPRDIWIGIHPEDRTIEERLDLIEAQVTAMHDKIAETEEMIRKLIAEVGPVVQEVIPMISNLVEHPMLRMLLKKK